VTLLLDRYGLGDARELVLAKRAGERTTADPALLAAWRPRLDQTLKGLDKAHAASKLPEDPHDPGVVQAWLVGARRSRLN
jgi:uncharacterized protein